MNRFTAYLIVRRHLKRAESRNQALMVEAIMEELGGQSGEPVERWGVLGLLSQLDLEYAEKNPKVRGAMVHQLAASEGLAAPDVQILEQWSRYLRDPDHADPADQADLSVDDCSPAVQALLVATFFAQQLLLRWQRGLELDRLSLTRELELSDGAGAPFERALSNLGLTVLDLARLALNAYSRVAEDLR